MTKKAEFNFNASPQDWALINSIVARGIEMGSRHGVKVDYMTAAMDLMTLHCNGMPLKLLQLLMSDESDFARDFTGIGIHIDRATGRLKNDFVPRFAVKH